MTRTEREPKLNGPNGRQLARLNNKIPTDHKMCLPSLSFSPTPSALPLPVCPCPALHQIKPNTALEIHSVNKKTPDAFHSARLFFLPCLTADRPASRIRRVKYLNEAINPCEANGGWCREGGQRRRTSAGRASGRQIIGRDTI